MLAISLLATISAVIVRLIMGFVVGIVALTRIDQAILPEWILRISYFDDQQLSYLAVVKAYHLHNHPMVIVFSRILCKSLKHPK